MMRKALLPLIAVLLMSATATPPFGEWKRLSETPILTPEGDGFDSKGIFNPAVVKKDAGQ